MDSIAAQNVFAVPVDRKLPKIRIRTRQVANLASQKFLVSIDAWDVTTRHPSGHFVRALGAVESKEAEIESLLLEFDVPYRPFPKAILDCLPVEGDSWVVPPKTPGQGVWKNREDLRDLTICSIDPIGMEQLIFSLGLGSLPPFRCQAVKILMTLYMRDDYPTAALKLAFVSHGLSIVLSSLGSLKAPIQRHCRCLSLCVARQSDGRRGCF